MSIKLTPDSIRHLLSKGIRVNVSPDTDVNFPECIYGVEKYTNHFGPGFMPLGAYSYSHSFTRDISEIGRYCSIGANLQIIRNTHPTDRLSSSPVFYSPRKLREWGGPAKQRSSIVDFESEQAPVTIGHDVWIGGDVRIRSGIHIGTGAIIGAGAIVTKDVGPYTIVAGVPAKVVKYRFEQPLIKRLLATQWWKYTPQDLLDYQPDEPEKFVALFENRDDAITPLEEIRFTPRQYLRQK